eukprot:COSAG01_NODE_8927_length_2611_cov_1.922373_4_plen_118_part_00
MRALRGLCPAATPMPAPAHVKMLNWRTGQVINRLSLSQRRRQQSQPQHPEACVVAARTPPLVIAGDWCAGESSFEGCAASAHAAAQATLRMLSEEHGGAAAAAAPAASMREQVSQNG